MALYSAAAAVLAGVESRQGSLKGLVYASRFQVAGIRPGRGVEWGGGRTSPGPARAQPVPRWPRAEREAAVRAGVRDAALRRRAGRRDRRRRPPPRREAAAAAGQGDGLDRAARGGAGQWAPSHFVRTP